MSREDGLSPPTLDELAAAVRVFGSKPHPDASMARLRGATGEHIDFDEQHRAAVRR